MNHTENLLTIVSIVLHTACFEQCRKVSRLSSAIIEYGEFNFEVQESGEGELGACESTDLGRKLSSDETIQTPNS